MKMVVTLTKEGYTRVGTHIASNFYGVSQDKIDYVENLKPILKRVIENSDLHVVNSVYHQFEPYGVSAMIVLSESHLSIHTWPEKGAALIDIFTCSIDGGGNHEEKAKKALELLIEELKPKEYECEILLR